MKLYEFEGKRLFQDYGIPIPRGQVVTSAAEAQAITDQMGCGIVLKSQILAGKRGKGGLIQFAVEPTDSGEKAAALLGRDYEGREVIGNLLLEEQVDIRREIYLALAIDRGGARPLFLACGQGGMDIEEIVRDYPQQLVKIPVNPLVGLQSYQVRKLVKALALQEQAGELAGIMRGMLQLFFQCKAVLVEINPLALTGEGHLLALDAKVELDDSAPEFKPDLATKLIDHTPWLKASELRSHQVHLQGVNSYVEMDGNIGVIGNGASLGMISFDVLCDLGGKPACFCDLGGNSGSTIKAALEAATARPQVRAVLVNVLGGGITRLYAVAKAMAEYMREHPDTVPVVARLNGHITEEDRILLREAGIRLFEDIEGAVQAVIALVA